MFFLLMVFNFFLCAVLGLLVYGLSYFYSGVFYSKSSAFECGFSPFMSSGVTFSMPFFVVSLMFLLFDVEIIIMSFPPFLGIGLCLSYWLVIFLVFLATCYEWKKGVLTWVSSFWWLVST